MKWWPAIASSSCPIAFPADLSSLPNSRGLVWGARRDLLARFAEDREAAVGMIEDVVTLAAI
jgi:hypothetical protein